MFTPFDLTKAYISDRFSVYITESVRFEDKNEYEYEF